MVTLDDVARRAGVSKSAVSRTLNADPSLAILESTREKILRAASELGYQSKRLRQTENVYQIAIIHKDTHYQSRTDNSYYFSIRYGIESACHSEHVQFSFLLNTMLQELPPGLDGAIINGNYNEGQLEEICQALGSVPAVLVAAMKPEHRGGLDMVTFDVRESVEIAMDHLREKGCRTVLYVGGRDMEGTPTWRQKRWYYRSYLERYPELQGLGLIEGEYGSESGYQMMRSWLQGGNPLPDGVFASHDPIAVGAIRALVEHGAGIPEQTKVVGVNGDDIGSLTVPPLTTVSVFTEEMGREAVRTLLERIRTRRGVPKRVIFQPQLIPRQST